MGKYSSHLAISDYKEFEWDKTHAVENFCMFKILSYYKLLNLASNNIDFTNEEQKLFDLERELIENGIAPSDTFLYINRVTGLSYQRIAFLLDRIEMKCYIRGVLLNEENPIPPRKIKNIYSGFFIKNKGLLADYKGY